MGAIVSSTSACLGGGELEAKVDFAAQYEARMLAQEKILNDAKKLQQELDCGSSIFGATLNQVPLSKEEHKIYDFESFNVENPELPDIMLACVEFLKQSDRLKVAGLFRIPGDFQNVLTLKKRISNSKETVNAQFLEDQDADVHSVATVFKAFLKEMKEPLLTHELYDLFIEYEKKNRSEELLQVIDKLPPLQKGTALFLLCFLAEVSGYEEFTQMSMEALAVLFAPNILRPKEETVQTMLEDSKFKKSTVISLIRLCQEKANVKKMQ